MTQQSLDTRSIEAQSVGHDLRQFVPKRTPELETPIASPKKKPSSRFTKFTRAKKADKTVKTANVEKAAKPPKQNKPAKAKKVKAPKVERKTAKLKNSEPKVPKPKKAKAERRIAKDRRKDRRKVIAANNNSKKSDASYQSLNKYLGVSYFSLFLLVGVVGTWSVFAKIQGAVIATGQVAVEGKAKLVQHLEGGIVSDITVKEGDLVTKGQTLLKLDSTILNANLEAAQTNYFENQALINRLTAEKLGQNRIVWSQSLTRQRSTPRVGLAMSGQEQLFQARQSALSGEIDQFTQRIEQLKDEDTGLISEIDFTQSELSLVEQEYVKLNELLRQNLISRSRVTQLDRDRTRLRNAVSKLESRRAGLNNSIKESQIKISQVQRLRQEQVLTDLRLAQTKADSYSEVLKTVSSKSKLVQIQAPASGVVHEMTVSTIGGVIAPGQEIMQIIPERESLIISAQVMPQDLDQVTLGQDTNVVFSSLKQSTAPELDGTVSYISADNLIDPITGSSYFVVEVEIADNQLSKLNGQSLVAGMPADIFIQTQEISVLDYLLGPLKDTLKKTMRDG